MNLRLDNVSTRSCVLKCATILVQVFLALIFSLVFVPAAFSQNDFSLAPGVFINEVLANEPGSNTRLEGVELHNADSVEHDLEGWAFISKDDTTWIPAGTTVPARGFLILARKLLSDPPDSISFEGWWGDGSGIWGDSPEESFPAIEAKMTLTNSGGTISLVDLENNV